jgi:succinate dehydrogenase hydrophobic anchor subunit
MRVLYSAVVLVAFVGGVAALRAGWLCRTDPERAGRWANPWAPAAVLVFLMTAVGPFMLWVEDGARTGVGMWLTRFATCLVIFALYLPYLTFHAGSLLAALLRPEPQPEPESVDPFERARASEEGGDVRAAVERYQKLLEEEPAHVEARTRLAQLMAKTRRFEQGKEILRQGLALEEVASAEKAEWKSLLRRLEEGDLGEQAPEDAGFGHLALGGVTATRIKAHEESKKDPPEDERPIEL